MSDVNEVMKEINSKFKKPVLFTPTGAEFERLKIKKIPTGSLRLDRALGGGVPRGFAVEFFGAEGGGKTTTALCTIAEAQKLGLAAAYVNLENRINLEWAKTLGVDVDKLLLYSPYGEPGEAILNNIITFLESKMLGVLVLDSLPGLISKKQMDGDMEDKTMGGNSALLSQFASKIMGSGVLRASDTCLIGINQVREKFNVMFGDPLTTPGGRFWRHLCLQRIKFTRGKDIMQADEPIGCEIKFDVPKNQLYKPKISGMYELYASAGIDIYSEVFDTALYYGFLTQRGAWFYYLDPETGEVFSNLEGVEYKWQGEKKVMASLIQDTFLFEDLLEKVRDKNNSLVGG